MPAKFSFLCSLALMVVLTTLLVVVFLSPSVTPTLDGYSHLYGGHILARRLAGDRNVAAYFDYNFPLLPNWLLPLTLAALSSIVPQSIALKLVVLFVAGALYGALYYAAGRGGMDWNRRALSALVLLPFSLNAYLTLGFYGFLCSIRPLYYCSRTDLAPWFESVETPTGWAAVSFASGVLLSPLSAPVKYFVSMCISGRIVHSLPATKSP